MTELSAVRVVLILGVLVSLCGSDNVGPRLLPLPLAPELASTPVTSDRGPAASRFPSHERTPGARVEMISTRQIRAGAECQSSQAAVYSPKFELAAPPASLSPGWDPYQPSAERSATFSRPKGRAPPRLV